MKHTIKYILPVCLLAAAVSCKMDLQPYDEAQNRLNFLYPSDTLGYNLDSTIRYTFVYEPVDTEYDTIWVPVRTIGFMSDSDRPVTLRQIDSPAPKAEAGKHFVPLDDPQLTSKYYWVRAGQAVARIPVVAIRHSDLESAEYSLMLEIVPNEAFAQGYPGRTTRLVYISDILTQPIKWDLYFGYNAGMGDYGKAKHQFMIDCVRDQGIQINDAWIDSIYPDVYTFDQGLTDYWSGFFTNKLIEFNRQRQADGLDVLREEPAPGEIEGVIVRFLDKPYI